MSPQEILRITKLLVGRRLATASVLVVLWICPVPSLAASQEANSTKTDKQLRDQWTGLEKDPDFLTKRQQRTPLAPRPKITDLEHTIIHYNPNTYCGHPRMNVFRYFGGDEIILGHFHGSSRYQVYMDVRHVCYQARSVSLLQRSTDGGKTWPEENNVIMWDRSTSPDEKQAFLFPEKKYEREPYGMSQPESVFFFSFTSEINGVPTTFCIRSPNKGYTWESVPAIIKHPFGDNVWIHRHNTPILRMPDGKTLLCTFQIGYWPDRLEQENGPALFYSKDQGLSWHFLSRPVVDLSGDELIAYSSLLLMPNGDLHCFFMNISGGEVDGLKNAIGTTVSKDGGKTWSDPVPIVGQGGDCWEEPWDKDDEFPIYRSPWSVLLEDGRMLVLFARRRMPGGIGGVLSADGGKTWSKEFIIRGGDAKWWDLGYPVGCQLDDGRIFVAYYYNMPTGGRNHGGTRYIAGSFFQIPK